MTNYISLLWVLIALGGLVVHSWDLIRSYRAVGYLGRMNTNGEITVIIKARLRRARFCVIVNMLSVWVGITAIYSPQVGQQPTNFNDWITIITLVYLLLGTNYYGLRGIISDRQIESEHRKKELGNE